MTPLLNITVDDLRAAIQLSDKQLFRRRFPLGRPADVSRVLSLWVLIAAERARRGVKHSTFRASIAGQRTTLTLTTDNSEVQVTLTRLGFASASFRRAAPATHEVQEALSLVATEGNR